MKAAYQHNGQRVSAEAFYQIACDPRRSVAVEACAGAGKTWMLVSRIVRALLDGVDPQTGDLRVQPHEILAITFTKRAASEMRERLYQWLADFAEADRVTLLAELQYRGVVIKNELQTTSKLPEQLSNLYKSILTSGRQVQVRTFHSWFASLLRTAPLAVLQRMALPPNYELLEDDAPAKALVWRRFYAALVADAEPSADAVQPLKADFEAVVFDYGRAQTEKALATALDKRTEFVLADAQGIVDTSVQHFTDQYPEFAWLQSPDEFLHAQPQRWQTLQDAAKALGAASAKTFAAKGAELEMALTTGDINAAFDALLTTTGTPRKFSEKVLDIKRVREAQDLVLRVVAARSQHAAWGYQQRMARLTRLLIAQYAALKRERNWVDMNDVERAALVMLGDPLLSGWVQERLDARIKHLLIDEFQDTNPLQWQALKSWLSGYTGAGGGGSGAAGSTAPSVFIVGDPKQSIYRFRRAEPQVFKAAKAFVRDGLGGDLLSCDHTRRNAMSVIATVNAAMLDAVQADGYEGFRPHTTSSELPGSVYKLEPIARSTKAGAESNRQAAQWRDSLTTPREVIEETLRTCEARQAAHWIANQLAHNGLQPADVMVLSRKRAGLMPLQDELRQLHITGQIGEKTALIDCCEVQDVVALLDVLVSPQHDLSLARVLKSPLFGMADTVLVQLALAQQVSPQPWFELVQKIELKTHDGRVLGVVLVQWKTWLDQLPPHDALQAIYTDGDVLARFACVVPPGQRDAVLANLRTLLAAALQLGGGRYATPYAFVRALKSGGVLAPAMVNPLAVRLLTIHGAKGLEAHTVLLLDTDTPERNADTMSVLIEWPGESEHPTKFVFLVSETQPPACAVPTLEAERTERQREELNALYVALTRARHTLAFSSIEPHRNADRSWWARLAELATAPTPEQHHHLVPLRDADSNTEFYMKELPLIPVQPLQDAIENGLNTSIDSSNENESFNSAGETVDDLTARIGLAMHRLLEWGDASVNNAAAAAREFELTPEQGTQAALIALRIFQGEGAWAWNPAVVGWQGNEVELMYQGEPLRLDRLVQRCDVGFEGQWWVLDYKSAHAPQDQPELIAQLREYRDAVQAIYPNDVVRTAFFTGLGTVVEVLST